MNIAIIPARGGSKRIPGKNIIDFMGKPLIAWTIEAAQKSQMFDVIVVSTDDNDIAKVAKEYGAKVYRREKETDDHKTVQESTIEALKDLTYQGGTVTQLMATCPLRNFKHIKQAAYLYHADDNIKFQLSVSKYGSLNAGWAMCKKSEAGHLIVPIFPDLIKNRSQDLKTAYCPSGAIWMADIEELYKQGTFYGNEISPYLMRHYEAIDIDTYEDLEYAEIVYWGMKEWNLGL